MTIMELGALGEFVGAFAVVATLSIARKSSTKSLSSPVKRTMPQGSTRPSTRMYLSGIAAFDVVQWFGGGFLDVSAIVGGAGAVSALKMCQAAYTKGSGALLLAIRAAAQSEGVTEARIAEQELSQRGLAQRSEAVALGSAPKGLRFVGEMLEIAHTFRGAGLPGGFHEGAAEIYRRMQTLQDSRDVTFDDVLAQLADPHDS